MPLRQTFVVIMTALFIIKGENVTAGTFFCWYLNSTSSTSSRELSIMFAITVLDYTEDGSRLFQPGE